jgi:Alpha/beta hydrolase of unknown function (DUF900)
MPSDRIANVVVCIVPGNDLRSQAMSSYVQQQILAGTIGFVSWQHSPRAWERELLASRRRNARSGAGAWSCSRFQRAGALLSFPLNAFVLNCAAKARRCDRAGREGILATTVNFATNRVVTNASDADKGYTSIMVPPLKPQEITYGTAIVDGINVATNAQGFVSEIKDTKQGGFSDAAVATLSNPGTDLLVFIHGFDNTFSDALTRAAFNREWLAASGQPGTNTTVVAFSWPSSGRVVALPVLADPYLADQSMARSSPWTATQRSA